MNASLEHDVSHLESILTCCEAIDDRIERFAITCNSFCQDDALQEMILFPLFQIGEHANHLSDELIEADSDTPWRQVIGLRHIIVHNYAKVDPHWVWMVLGDDFANLEQHARELFFLLSNALEHGYETLDYTATLAQLRDNR